MSGIVSILCFGVVLNRYNYFNLSPDGRVSSKYKIINSETLSFLFQTLVKA